MKRIVSAIFMAAVAISLFTGCKGKDSVANDPKAVVIAFFEKMSKKDIDGASKLATKSSQSTMEMMKKVMTMGEEMKDKMGGKEKEKDPAEDFKNMKFGETKIDGDNATVTITNPSKDNKTFEFPLKKEDGSWKVDFSMGTLMKMGMKDGGMNGSDDINMPDTTGASEKLDNLLNNDTLKESLNKMKEELEKLNPEKQ
ncbi:MAG: DUF4878 domain-containing protein [Bacteroidetes bacterium]|nr:DUF4878 domain-containing protein [Bacteroidota bacterium]